MARIRTIKPSFYTSEDLSSLPEVTHYGMASGLLTYADDEGYFNANEGLIRAALFPLREPSVSVHEMLTQLSSVSYLRLGSTPDGKRYGLIVKFDEHQRVNRPTPSKIKELPIQWDDSLTTHGALTEPSPLERKGKERNKEAAAPRVDLVLHESLPRETWGEWMERRKQKRWPCDDLTLRKQLALLTEYDTATQREILDTAIRSGWQGIFRPKTNIPPKQAEPKRTREFGT
jgi:hypothetical protein